MNYKKIIVVAAVVFALIVAILAMGYLRFKKFEGSMYPSAPPMPPVVSQTVDDVLAQLDSQLQTNAPWVLTNLQPGLTLDRINELERQAAIQIPDDLKALYHWHDGFNYHAFHTGGPAAMSPLPMTYFLPLEEALQARLAADRDLTNNATAVQRTAFDVLAGFTKPWIVVFDENDGNGYYFDPQRNPEQGAVFYHDMEDGEYVFFPSAKNLLAAIVKGYQTKTFYWESSTNGSILTADTTAAQKLWDEFGVSASVMDSAKPGSSSAP